MQEHIRYFRGSFSYTIQLKRILLIEDDKRIAQNIYRGLNNEGFDIQVAYDGITGKQLAISDEYDLLLLDINLPGMKGTEVCRQVREYKPKIPIIMLTAYGEIEDKIEGLQRGADDYMVKPFDFRELVARISAAIRRAELYTEVKKEILTCQDLEMNVDSKTVTRQGQSIELTAREFKLLEYLLRNQDRVIPKMELAEHVWNLNFDPGTNVVEVYINYLRRKIDKDFQHKLIQTRPGLGYTFKDPGH